MKPKPRPKLRSSKSKSKSESNSLAVTVFDENVACDEHARPLNFVDSRSAFSEGLPELTSAPEMAGKDGVREMQEHRSLRRSPRLSPLPDLPSPSKKARGSLGNVAIDNCVRSSPRLASADVEAGNGKTFVQHKKCKGGSMGSNGDEKKDTEKFTRTSPRLMNQSEMKCCYPKVSTQELSLRNLESCEKGCSRAMSLRTADAERSPRDIKLEHLSDSKEKCPSKKILVNTLNEKHIRRSPRFSPSVAAANSNSNSSIELSGSKGMGSSKKIMVSLGTSDLKCFDGRCLRQSPIRATSMFEVKRKETECAFIQLPETETRETEHAFIELPETFVNQPPKNVKTFGSSKNRKKNCETSFFIGDPIPDVEAQERWGWRYQLKSQRSNSQSMKLNDDGEDEIILNVECHFAQAKIGNCIFSLGDCVYVQGNEGKKDVGRIIEFFKTTDGENYFRVQWFYRVEDTVIKEVGSFHDKRRLFYSTVVNDNLIDCIISKVNVTQISPRVGLKVKSIASSDFYYDMEYCIDYSTFRTLVTVFPDNSLRIHSFSSSNLIEMESALQTAKSLGNSPSCDTYNAEFSLLDLYCGCGGMSTGLCLGAKLSSVNLVTKWALDSDKSACESLKLNHPETHVRNEAAEDFLELLKEWEKLCRQYEVDNVERTNRSRSETSRVPKHNDETEFEVSRIIDICYGDPNKTGKRGVNFRVRWKGYGSSDDTWEPIGGLSNCKESIRDFVKNGKKLKILPLPGDADVICGGPPCQGISGYNRFRNVDSPLDDEKNRQIIVFMDIVNLLKPKYVLMENVADILRFDKASLGRYALSRLVQMTYQARLGIIAAGCYGLPQFRLRVFLWGAHPSENLPQFPRPTHDVIIRYWPPPEFERNVVAYDEDQPRELEKALLLQDAISDLPAVKHNETSEEMSFKNPPETDFQRYIRSTQYEMVGSALDDTKKKENLLYDHRSYPLHEDDYARVCQIPKRKGANFRDLPGVVVGRDNVARRDLTEKQSVLPSGKPLVPDYAFTFEQGKSKRPFARLWWDETVATVLTFPSCHNQVVLHPEQDRILTLRECARLQGFPDYYRFCGTVRERYCQVGNAVAIPVARALGYALGLAVNKSNGNEPLLTLPQNFSHSNYFQFTEILPPP
ncbi:DNA (cytosine-5)-methyltransferase CMT2 isoform X1 [Rosa chinensis]|uniref:DNA (cytosine-5)-methyltransferase CMT2 isoform X1 n=2 Tax=Rosa chinensis TaxID=74649 RepID=UPI000D09503F|nr:DNA (cytosine-5)-methyltransferase CMT2 isoform X1 [Rosa chinensis]